MGVVLIIIIIAILFVCIKDKKGCFKKRRVLRKEEYGEESTKDNKISRNLWLESKWK